MAVPKIKFTVRDPTTSKHYRVTLGRHRVLCAQGGQQILLRINEIGKHFTQLQLSNWLTHGRAIEITEQEAIELLPRVKAMARSDLALRRARYRLGKRSK